MIQIYADGVLAYDSRLKEAGKDYTLLGLKVTTGLNKGGTAEIVMPPGHPAYSAYTSYRTIVEIVRDGVLLFRGRALYPTDDFYNRRTVTCEGELCFFQDGVSRPYLYQDDPATIFAAIVGYYNSQVEEFKRFKVGTVTVTDANNYIRLESETAESYLDTLNKLLDRCGGYITFSTDAEGERRVNWYAELTRQSGQEIEFGSNLLSFSRSGANTDLLTAIVPYGAKDEETGERLTIKSVNSGKDYIQDDEAVALRGIIMKSVTWDDVTVPANLLKKAKAYLAEHRNIVTSLELTAVDLSCLDKSIDSYQVGDVIRVKSKPHAVDAYFQLTERTEDLLDPSGGSITLGKDIRTLTGADVAGDNQSRSDLQKTTQSIKADYKLNTSQAVAEVERVLRSEITQQADSIKLEVTDGTPGNTATIKLTVGDKVYSGKIDMTGLVTFTNLKTKGQTVINGSNITTGEILANLIKAGQIHSAALDGTAGGVGIDLDAGLMRASKWNDDESGDRAHVGWDNLRHERYDSDGALGQSRVMAGQFDAVQFDSTGALCSLVEIFTQQDGYSRLTLTDAVTGAEVTLDVGFGAAGLTGLTAPVNDSDAVNKAYVDGKFFGRRRLLTSADDCDDITEDGVYWYSTSSVPANAPFANAAIIEVFGNDSDTTQKIQRGTRYGAGGFSATRALYGGSWSAWHQYALTTNGVIPVANGGTGGTTVATAQAALRVNQDFLFSQLNAAGDKTVDGINAYPTKPGVYRVTTGSANFGVPGNYGCLVIFAGGGYYMHLYVNADGFWTARTTSMTAPTWKKMATA